MKVLLQSLLLLFSFALVFIWEQSPSADFNIQVIGFLIAAYVIISLIRSRQGKEIILGGSTGVFILNTIILLLIFGTGGLSSSFFFLIYFIIFALVFVFEPYTIASFCIGAILIFLPIALKDDVVGNFIKLGSVLLISPFALFFGREYQKSETEEAEIDKIKDDLKEVLVDPNNKLNKKAEAKLEDALTQAEKLKE